LLKRVDGYSVKRQYFTAELPMRIEKIGLIRSKGFNSPISSAR